MAKFASRENVDSMHFALLLDGNNILAASHEFGVSEGVEGRSRRRDGDTRRGKSQTVMVALPSHCSLVFAIIDAIHSTLVAVLGIVDAVARCIRSCES